MPWKETDIMNLRTEFVMRALHAELPFRTLCAEYGISTKTGYKWKERFLKDGLKGLADQSRRPHTSPGELAEDDICRLVEFKAAHRTWGPKKIRELFARAYPGADVPSLSTVKRVFDKAGLVKHRRRRRAEQCGRIASGLRAEQPNDLWTVDFKGWWYSTEKERIEPLTVRDAYSRYVLCVQALEDARTQTIRRRFEAIFATYGLPRVIRSDNGSPFASTSAPLGLSRLSAWWVALGIGLDRIEPGRPEQNGGHERMHRDIAIEVEAGPGGDLVAEQAALQTWRHEFNHERPHEALGMQVPADLYAKSPRTYDPSEIELTYPADYHCRKACQNGTIKFAGVKVRVSQAVAGWQLGLKATGSRHHSVWFGPLCLGELDLRAEVFRPAGHVLAAGAQAIGSDAIPLRN